MNIVVRRFVDGIIFSIRPSSRKVSRDKLRSSQQRPYQKKYYVARGENSMASYNRTQK